MARLWEERSTLSSKSMEDMLIETYGCTSLAAGKVIEFHLHGGRNLTAMEETIIEVYGCVPVIMRKVIALDQARAKRRVVPEIAKVARIA